jgi:predicted AAA+ superfamily ATPase
MKRTLENKLLAWKNSPNRKPLVIKGARQVGKTWLIKEFGNKHYKQLAYINFESNKALKNIFLDDFDISRILLAIQIETGISITEETLIVFDEIQESVGALTSLKYFQENAPEYQIISAGSLLGIAMTKESSFPVGKVEFLNLYPLDFEEFLDALGETDLLSLLQKTDWDMMKVFKTKLVQLLKQYYFTGGMPEVVLNYSRNQDFNEVRSIQQRILDSYFQDFSKHAPNEIVPRIRMLWNSIPAQLAKENKKFIYGIIKQGARAKDYEMALSWLFDCGLVHKVNRVSKAGIPLKAYEDFNAFKLFLLDVGLLGAMVDLDVKTLLEGNKLFEEFKGAITEQYVLQQLIAKNLTPYYWTADGATAEIDFLLQHKGKIIPIEVKSEENLKAKSLKLFSDKFKPCLALRTSMSDYRKEDWLTNIPLYAVGQIPTLE